MNFNILKSELSEYLWLMIKEKIEKETHNKNKINETAASKVSVQRRYILF